MTDGDEVNTHGTDPCNNDTDGDGFFSTFDGFEVNGPDGIPDTGDEMNPLDPDTDDDGIWDGEEMDMWLELAGLDPDDPDLTVEQIQDAVYKCTPPNEHEGTDGYDVDGDTVRDGNDECPLDPFEGIDVDENGCTDDVEGLEEFIEGLEDVPYGIITSLIAKLHLNNEDVPGLIYSLNALKNEAEALRGQFLTDGQADLLIEYANGLICALDSSFEWCAAPL